MKYYSNELVDYDNIKTDEGEEMKMKKKLEEPKDGEIKPRKKLKPILQKLSERKPR